MRLLLPFSFSASRDSDGGEFEELWQVEQGAEEGDGESVGADVPPLPSTCCEWQKRKGTFLVHLLIAFADCTHALLDVTLRFDET